MCRPKILSVGVLLAVPVLGLAAAPSASAAESAKVVTGQVSTPGGRSVATCPAGTHLTGGGYRFTPARNDDAVVFNGPSDDANGWAARAEYGTVVAFAVCETED
ncbi:hypothetical protein PUR71_23550 [Streptomyces sp. SP17BM10]|uniref:hypothetical protein n=1 Tax=Streptomyces sp. SP17BM10 TaxID=3002530 RepID=UPI002E78B989|nr:hypothetical protein [Streptomyces sp. SP17BM10]MEE1785855.1 hypothetical protein [Streptomyces sp. SP17BM10]